MSRHLAAAREAVQSAADIADDSTVHEQLESIDSGLEALSSEDAPGDATEQGDRLEQLEAKITGLADETDGETLAYLETARDHVDAYRREYAPDWEA